KEHMVVAVVNEEKREHHNVVAVLKGEPREPEHTANEEQRPERASHIDPIKIAKVARTSAGQPRDVLACGLAPLLWSRGALPGESEILERVPGVKTLKRNFETMAAITGNKERQANGRHHQENLRIMHGPLLYFSDGFAKEQQEGEGKEAGNCIAHDGRLEHFG